MSRGAPKQLMTVTIPPGVQAGSVLTVQAPTGTTVQVRSCSLRNGKSLSYSLSCVFMSYACSCTCMHIYMYIYMYSHFFGSVSVSLCVYCDVLDRSRCLLGRCQGRSFRSNMTRLRSHKLRPSHQAHMRLHMQPPSNNNG
jgi:hypothetical protein